MSRQEEEISKWSELCPDLLRSVFKRLSFTELSRAKSVCSSWNSASKGCVPKQNQIPWLILFPRYNFNKHNYKSSSCTLFVPEDKKNVYKTRDLGIDFVENRCLATYGSWLLMVDRFGGNKICDNLYILNPLTSERIDLPDTKRLISQHPTYSVGSCFWIDNITKDYLVVLTMPVRNLFIKKAINKWHEFPVSEWFEEVVYNHKNQKLYVHKPDDPLTIWDCSGDEPCKEEFLDCFRFNHYDFPDRNNFVEVQRRLAVTISGDVLIVSYCCRVNECRPGRFYVYEANHVNRKWVEINSLGDEALILDMGVTVVAKDVPGIKRNSIYFSGISYGRDCLVNIFVFDLTTQKIEPLPQCVYSSFIQFSDARWFFPGFNG